MIGSFPSTVAPGVGAVAGPGGPSGPPLCALPEASAGGLRLGSKPLPWSLTDDPREDRRRLAMVHALQSRLSGCLTVTAFSEELHTESDDFTLGHPLLLGWPVAPHHAQSEP